MTIDRHKLRGAYARLKRMQQAAAAEQGVCPGTLGNDFNKMVAAVGQIIAEPTDDFPTPRSAHFDGSGGSGFYHKNEVVNKLNQIISYLEYTQHVSADFIQIGSIFNSIQRRPVEIEMCRPSVGAR